MSPRHLIANAVLIALVASLGACQSTFPRACLKAEDCEHHPINGPSALDAGNGPLVLGGEKSIR